MSIEAPAWFKEIITDQVHHAYQARGHLLDGTMTSGDRQANTVKFPTMGTIEAYEITGAIQLVSASSPEMGMVEVSLKDYEASVWHRTQDAYKMGPNEQAALAFALARAIGRQADTIKLNALAAFCAAKAVDDTIGDGSTAIDILDLQQAAAEIWGTGEDDVEMYCGVPNMWFEHLKLKPEFGNADYVGSMDLPFARRMGVKKKTWNSVHVFTLPDAYFAEPAADEQYAYLWVKSAIGAETPWDKRTASFTTHPEYEGTPLLGKVGMGGAAIGIDTPGVKRLHFAKLTRPARPA